MEASDKAKEALYEYLVTRLGELQEEKAQFPKVPSWVTKSELFSAFDKDVKNTLNQMFRDKKIKVHKTIHDSSQDYVELVK